MNTQTDIQAALMRSLDEDEKLIWSGHPDVATLARGKKRYGKIYILIVVLFCLMFVLAFFGYFYQNMGKASLFADSKTTIIIFAAMVLMGVFVLFKNRGELKQWAQSLGYGITDRRLIILRNGVIDQEFTISDVPKPKIVVRKKAPGFADIIWGRRKIRRSGSSNRNRSLTPLEYERLNIGFKALPNAIEVMELIESWRQNLIADTASQAQSFVKASANQDNSEQHEKNADDSTCYQSPKLNFSIEFPASWDVSAGNKKLIFGKWGIESETRWSDPEGLSKWNIIQGKNEANTTLELQVHKTKPINTLEKMQSLTGSGALAIFELVDQEAYFEAGGIPGFYLTQKSKTDGGGLAGLLVQGSSAIRMRQYVLHDGSYQYYIKAHWEQDAPGQEEIINAIVSSLKAVN